MGKAYFSNKEVADLQPRSDELAEMWKRLQHPSTCENCAKRLSCKWYSIPHPPYMCCLEWEEG